MEEERFVLDASAALAWMFIEEQDQFAVDVLKLTALGLAHVPSLFHLEVGNALISAERQGRAMPNDFRRVLGPLRKLPIQIDGETSQQAWTGTIELASSTGLSLYDAAYLELAERLNLPLVTRDQLLRQIAIKRSIRLLHPAG